MFASLGSLPVMSALELVITPLPASGNHCQSLSLWRPYLVIEKLLRRWEFGPSFATQPIIGMVIIGCAPPFLESLMNSSSVAPGPVPLSGRLSKYQSAAWFEAFVTQL